MGKRRDGKERGYYMGIRGDYMRLREDYLGIRE